MKATLYEALGIPQTASDEEVRAALRGQIRKYYAKTRDGHGNVEEALRFINHASRILSDPGLRGQYDYELRISAGTVEQRIAHVVNGAVGRARRQEPAVRAAAPTLLQFPGPSQLAPVRNSHHAGLTEGVTSFRRSTSVAIVMSAAFGLIIAGAVAFITPADVVLVAKQVLVWLTLLLVSLTVIYGVVHAVAWTQQRHALSRSTLATQPETTILNWRREKSVFLGTNQPQEDAGWIFQLRMAELERAKSGRTSEPRLWNRLGARLFDYALWGLFLALPMAELNALGIVSDGLAGWLTHPLVAPILITASWIPIETLLIAVAQTTPGKWLFGVYIQFSISDAYAARDKRSRLTRACKRALRVWWEGMGCGFPLLTPICIAVAYEKVAQKQETSWDFAEDCLVTHESPGSLNMLTGVVGLAAMLWLYGVVWHQTMAESIDRMRASAATTLHFVPALVRGGVGGGGAIDGGTVNNGSPSGDAASAMVGGSRTGSGASSGGAFAGAVPLDPDLVPLFADRHAKIAALRVEGPRMLKAQNWRRAGDLCRAWADLELGNADAWRCLGEALQAQGNPREAVTAYRKAKQFDHDDPAIDRAISRSQGDILADFLRRHGR